MKHKTVDRKVVVAVWIVGFLAVWELIALLIRTVIPVNQPDTKIPYFHSVLISFFQQFAEMSSAAWETFQTATQGFLIGLIIGCIVALIMSWSRLIENMIYPYLIAVQMIPVLGLAPIFYKLCGGGDAAKIAISAFISFFPISVNLLGAFDSVSLQRKELMASYATAKPWVYWKLMIPSALPGLFTGMKIAAPRTITAAILIEMMGATSGIGVKIINSLYYNGVGSLVFWTSVLMSSILGMLSYLIVVILEKIFVPWEAGLEKGGGTN